MIKSTVNPVAECHPKERQSYKMLQYILIRLIRSGTLQLLSLLSSMKDQCFDSIQDTKAAMIAQLKILERGLVELLQKVAGKVE